MQSIIDVVSKDSCSATRDCGDFQKWLSDQSEVMSAALSTADVQNQEFDDDHPILANPLLSMTTVRNVAI
jgi:hypothetical protein